MTDEISPGWYWADYTRRSKRRGVLGEITSRVRVNITRKIHTWGRQAYIYAGYSKNPSVVDSIEALIEKKKLSNFERIDEK